MIEISEVSWRTRLLQREYTLRVTADGEEHSVTLPLGIPGRGDVVNALIRTRYPQDQMEAVTNNYMELLTRCLEEGTKIPEGDSRAAEYASMQRWREESKAAADKFIGEYGQTT